MKYSMTEVSKRTNIAPSAIRYYEEKGLLHPIKRKASGVHEFTQSDIERLSFIIELKAAGLSIQDIHECFQYCDEGDETIGYRIQLFQQHKHDIQLKIQELQLCIQHIDDIITYLQNKKIQMYHLRYRKYCIHHIP